MNIHEAARLAHEHGTGIYRRDNPFSMLTIIPTNTSACCIVISPKEENPLGQKWNPTLADLLATDWEVYGISPRQELGQEVQDAE